MARVIQKKKGFKFDFDFILKVFFVAFAIGILVLVALKIEERIENNKVKKVEPLFSSTEYGDYFVRNVYGEEKGALDGFFEDDELQTFYDSPAEGLSFFIFVYNSDLDVYIDETIADDESTDENEQEVLIDFITKDFNSEKVGEQSLRKLITDYISKLNTEEHTYVYLLDLHTQDQYYGEYIPVLNLAVSEDTLALCQITFETLTEDNYTDYAQNKVFQFNTSGHTTVYNEAAAALGAVLNKLN